MMSDCTATWTHPAPMPRICLVTALAAESRPWLDALKLRQMSAHPLRLYGSGQYLLLETGVGKLNAAASVGALLQIRSDITHLVNLGIAGGSCNIGSVFMAQRIKDVASSAQWFPHLPPRILTRDIRHASIYTVDQACEDYQADILYDMEASAIVNAALRYLSTSQVHSFKVVSDNPASGISSINVKRVTDLIQTTVPCIKPVLEGLLELSTFDSQEQHKSIADFVNLVSSRAHHTSNQKIQLQRLVERYKALSGQLPSFERLYDSSDKSSNKSSNESSNESFDESFDAKSIKLSLQNQLESMPLEYNDV